MPPTNYYVDPAAGSDATGNGTSGTPWQTVQYALNNITRDSTNGDQINIKAGGTDTLTAALSLSTYGTPSITAPLVLRGYTSAANDGGQGVISGGGSYSIFASTTLDYVHLIDLKLHNVGGRLIVGLRFYCLIENCEICTNTGAYYAIAVQNGSVISRCSIYGTQFGISMITAAAVWNYINDTGSNMTQAIAATTHCLVMGNIIRLNATGAKGIDNASGGGWFLANSIYNNAAGTAQGIKTTVQAGLVVNNIIQGFSGSGGEAIDGNSQAIALMAGNAYYNNTATETAVTKVILSTNNDTLSGSAWVAPNTGDYDINGTVTDVTEDAYPAAFQGASSTAPKADKGAVQAGAGAGSSGGLLTHPGMSGGARG